MTVEIYAKKGYRLPESIVLPGGKVITKPLGVRGKIWALPLEISYQLNDCQFYWQIIEDWEIVEQDEMTGCLGEHHLEEPIAESWAEASSCLEIRRRKQK